MHIHFTVASANSKTGTMLVTTQSADTCPPTCKMKGNGCYAEAGPILWHWRKVSAGERVRVFQDFLGALRRLQRGSLWRLSQAGDLPGYGNRIDAVKLRQIIAANKEHGLKGFTYTHKQLTRANRALIKEANQNGFTINLSADSLKEADELLLAGVGPVVVVIPEDPSRWPKATPGGVPIVPCLHNTKGLQCTQCGLCAVAGRKSVVGFPAHGTRKARVEQVLQLGGRLHRALARSK